MTFRATALGKRADAIKNFKRGRSAIVLSTTKRMANGKGTFYLERTDYCDEGHKIQNP